MQRPCMTLGLSAYIPNSNQYFLEPVRFQKTQLLKTEWLREQSKAINQPYERCLGHKGRQPVQKQKER